MALSACRSPDRQRTPPPNKHHLLSPDSTRLHSPYDYIKRARSLTPAGARSPAMRSPEPVRRRLQMYESFDDAVRLLKGAQNVVVLAGAGISTCVGIPDFRSKDGLYNKVNAKKRFADPQDLFTTTSFCDAPLDFYSDVMPIIPKLRTVEEGGSITKAEDIVAYVPRFGLAHAFFNLLEYKDKLQTIYTQNIDGLEKAAGVGGNRVINCHGSWDTATCMTCQGKVSADGYLPVIFKGALPLCACAKPVDRDVVSTSQRTMRGRPKKAKEEIEYLQASKPRLRKSESTPTLKKRKRNSEDDTDDPQSRPGLLKPDVTFFDEGISRAYKPRLLEDAKKVDLLLIIGTSLPVEPVNKLPFEIPASVPQVWISREHCQRAGLKVDIELLGDCNSVIEELCRRAGWTNRLENRTWRNKYGSAQQAKEQLLKLKQERTAVKEKERSDSLKIEGSPSKNVVSATESAPAVVVDRAVSAGNAVAVATNSIPLRLVNGTSPALIQGLGSREVSPAKAQADLPQAKVKMEADVLMEWRWYVTPR